MLRDSTHDQPKDNRVHLTPTFNYFNAKLTKIADLNDYFARAKTYIDRQYPDAIAGEYQDKYALRELMDAANIPPPDQYFLRLKTRQNYFSMIYADMHVFSENAEKYVRDNPQLALKLYKMHPSQTSSNNMFSLFGRYPTASSLLLFGAIVATGSFFNMRKK